MIAYEEVLREFDRKKVKYILVGGIAFNLLGGFRGTSDMDLLVDMSDKNLEKIVKILKKQGYYVKQPVDPIKIANKKIRKNWIENKHMKAFNFYKDNTLQEVDLIIESPVSFSRAKKTLVKIPYEDITLPVISIDNLIKMKKQTGRKIDDVDIKDLRQIKKLRKEK
ncbi:MAG: hypothetical protein ISS92_06140 [Candidatus Omnitrophica bacterium]|nr:hypothetical protein [Candidatus Omnitrophota bacterium]